MCLAVPAKIIEIYDNAERGLVDYGGIKKKTILSLIENPKIGEYVIIHAGYAIEKLHEEDALESLKLWDELLKTID